MCLSSDIYVLCDSRSHEKIVKFLEKFLPNNIEDADMYYIPYLSENPEISFEKLNEFMQYMENATDKPNAIYWRNSQKEGDPRFAMVFYTDDGKMILGLSLNESDREEEVLEKIQRFVNSNYGYITFGDIPPTNSDAFIKKAYIINHSDKGNGTHSSK